LAEGILKSAVHFYGNKIVDFADLDQRGRRVLFLKLDKRTDLRSLWGPSGERSKYL